MAKEIWDKLEVTYEGTSRVKESKINLLVTQYEVFKMVESESINEMYSRFTNIINSLKALGKTYTQPELIRKILRSLPATWIHKVSAIEESKDLDQYQLEELIRSLMTHEIHIQNLQGKNDFRKKDLALKATKEEQEKDASSSDHAVAMALLPFLKVFFFSLMAFLSFSSFFFFKQSGSLELYFFAFLHFSRSLTIR